MTPEEQAEKEAATAAAKAKEEAEAKAKADLEANPDPLKKELDRVNGTKSRTEAEKAAFSLKKNAERAKELGLDPLKVLGLDEEEDDSKPLTQGDLKRIELEKASKSALDKAESIEDETERELTKYHLSNTIKSSGNADEDFRRARAIVNETKNAQIAEEAQRKGQAKRHVSSAGAPGKLEGTFEPTAEEAVYMKAPFNLSKEKILEARQKVAEAQG